MTTAPSQEDVSRSLGLDGAARRRRTLWRWLGGGLLAAVLAAAVWYFLLAGEDETVRYVTVPAALGDLQVTVTATGTLEPTNDVDVSSELSGIVRTVLVDYNDAVKAGQVLAELDTVRLEAEVARARATLAASKARVKEAQASRGQARQDFDRYKQLVEKRTASQQKYEEAKAVFERAEAALESAAADVAIAEADLRLRETDLSKASIRSPVDGVVLSRNVDPGQTVAATLQAPVLFTLAEDLATMELQVDVDEADVGLVDVGQAATFTVDAYADRLFDAAVTKVRYAPTTTEGVVTYTTHLWVDNSALLLRPGMTATAEIAVRTVSAGLLIPNEALRFAPPQAEAEAEGGVFSRLLPRPPGTANSQSDDAAGAANEKRIWVLREGQPVAVAVTVGLSDGESTEIVGGDLQKGDAVIVDTEAAGS